MDLPSPQAARRVMHGGVREGALELLPEALVAPLQHRRRLEEDAEVGVEVAPFDDIAQRHHDQPPRPPLPSPPPADS